MSDPYPESKLGLKKKKNILPRRLGIYDEKREGLAAGKTGLCSISGAAGDEGVVVVFDSQ